MALGTSKLDELYALIPEEVRKDYTQYTIKIGKEIVYRGDFKANWKINQLGDRDFDAIFEAIRDKSSRGQAITIMGGIGKAAEKLFYRDSKGSIKVNSFESLIEEEPEEAVIDSTFPEEVFPEEVESVLTSEEMQEALNAFGYEEPGIEAGINGGYQEALDAFGYEPEEVEPYEQDLTAQVQIEESTLPKSIAAGDRVQFRSPHPISGDIIPVSPETVGVVLEVNRNGKSLQVQFDSGEPPEYWDTINFEPENLTIEKVEAVDRRKVDKSITTAELRIIDAERKTGSIDEYFLHVHESTVAGVKAGGLVGPFDSMESAQNFRQDNLTNPKVSLGSVYAGSFFKVEAIENAITPDDLEAAWLVDLDQPDEVLSSEDRALKASIHDLNSAIEPEIKTVKEPEKPTSNRFSLKGLGQAIQGKAKAVAQQVQENVQGHVASNRDKLPASAIALLELHDSKLKDPALAWIGRKLEQAKPELVSLREQIQKTGVDAARKGLQAVANVPSAVLDQAVSSSVVNLMNKLGSETLIEGAQHYLTENYVMSRQGNRYQVNDSNGKELLTFTQEKISRNVTTNNLDRLQVSELLKADKQVTLMPEKPTLAQKVSLGNFAPMGSRERVQRDQEQQISTILKAAIAVRGQEQPNGDRVFEGETFYAKQSGDTIQLSRKADADILFAVDTTSRRAETNHLDSKEVAQILKFGAALEQAIQTKATTQKPVMATR